MYKILCLGFVGLVACDDKGDTGAPCEYDSVQTLSSVSESEWPGRLAENVQYYEAIEGSWEVVFSCTDRDQNSTSEVATLVFDTASTDELDLVETSSDSGPCLTGDEGARGYTSVSITSDFRTDTVSIYTGILSSGVGRFRIPNDRDDMHFGQVEGDPVSIGIVSVAQDVKCVAEFGSATLR